VVQSRSTACYKLAMMLLLSWRHLLLAVIRDLRCVITRCLTLSLGFTGEFHARRWTESWDCCNCEMVLLRWDNVAWWTDVAMVCCRSCDRDVACLFSGHFTVILWAWVTCSLPPAVDARWHSWKCVTDGPSDC